MKRNFRLNTLLLALITGNVIWGGTVVHAEEPNQKFILDPMIVTAQRTEKDDINTPASVNVLSQEQLLESGATNLFDALRLTNGVTAYGFGANGQAWGGMAGKVLIRGNDKGTLVMIDGSPINMNNVYYLNTLPIDAIEKIEIVKGASSVLYGSEASAGVINIITKEVMANSISFSKGEYGKTKESVSIGLGKFGFVANLEQGKELKKLASNGRAMNDGKKNSILWKYKFDDKWTLTHQHTLNDYNFNQYDTKTWNILKEDARYKYNEDFARLQYQDDSVKGSFYYNRSDRKNNTFKVNNSKYTPVGTTIERQNYSLDNPWSAGKLVNQKVDKNSQTYALFVQGTKDLGNDFTVTIGAREQIMKANDDYDAFTPEFALIKKLDENSSVYVNAAKAFKMPNFTALYGSGSESFVPNPNLKPEEGWTYELGYKKASNSSMFKTALYYIDMDAWSYKTVDGDKNKPINSPFENIGLEINYEKAIGEHLAYSVGADFSNPKAKDEGVWNRKYARQQYTGSLKYNNRGFAASLIGSITADRAGNWTDMIPVNLYTGYNVDKNSKIEVICENLFNRKDIILNWTSSTSTEYYSLPRNIRVVYTYKF